jgi:hypothetical protein
LFGTDPIQILNSDELDWVLRLACAKVISQDRKRQQEEMEKKR